mgnify:CR=1 FL=1
MNGRLGLSLAALLATGCTTYAVQGNANKAERVDPCVEDAIVTMLATTDAERLKGIGVHTKAANSLEATRNGADGLYGTDDDVSFADLAQVDAVSQVGPSAMDALLAWAEPLCDDGGIDPVAVCASDAFLDFVNTATEEQLDAAGVYYSGVDSILAMRPFEDRASVDAAPGVGDSSMNALTRWAEGSCRAQVVFSPQDYDSSHLARVAAEIDGAQTSLDIAMYSWSDSGVMDAVFAAAAKGVSVRALLEKANSDRKNLTSSTLSARLEEAGIEVRWVNKVMHHKYVIVDGARTEVGEARDALLITGSGNWSYSAGTKYDEDTLFLRDEKLALAYQQEFEYLWTNGRLIDWNEDIEEVVGLTITPDDLDQADGAEALFTSANFRTYTSSVYGPTFSRDGDKSNVQDRLAELILSAEDSIWIASGHLRNRPIAEAILAAYAADPTLDIRVYTDGQEYTSAWYSDNGVAETEACLAEAIDADDEADCLEDGVYWGYQLHKAGVPVRFKLSAYRWDYRYAEQMHQKTLIVDQHTVATGSYNYSKNAEYDTFENVAVLTADRYGAAVAAYGARFEQLWETRREDYEPLVDDILYGSDDVSIVFPGMALTWDEVDYLKWLIGETCPDVDSWEYRENPSSHWTCDR